MSAKTKGEAIACEGIAPKQHNVNRIIGKGDTKDAAETDLNDKILDKIVAERDDAEVSCYSGTCGGGAECYTTIEIGQVTFRRIRRPGRKKWTCIYQGAVTSKCICVA